MKEYLEHIDGDQYRLVALPRVESLLRLQIRGSDQSTNLTEQVRRAVSCFSYVFGLSVRGGAVEAVVPNESPRVIPPTVHFETPKDQLSRDAVEPISLNVNKEISRVSRTFHALGVSYGDTLDQAAACYDAVMFYKEVGQLQEVSENGKRIDIAFKA